MTTDRARAIRAALSADRARYNAARDALAPSALPTPARDPYWEATEAEPTETRQRGFDARDRHHGGYGHPRR